MRNTVKNGMKCSQQDEYYTLTHITLPKAHMLFVEAIVGEIDKLKNKRAWISVQPIPFMEVEAAWARVCCMDSSGWND